MTPLDQEDVFHLTRAIGWLELGNWTESNEELENISAAKRSHPDILEIRQSIYAKAQKWDACLDIARAIIVRDDARLSAWITQAYALRRSSGGSLQAAYDALLPAANHFPFQSVVPFNLACYAAQLGNIEDAEVWFKRALQLATADFKEKEFKLKALEEPDLDPLWKAKGKTTFFRDDSTRSSNEFN